VLEGLDPLEGFATEKTCGPVQVLEDGLRFEVDLASSQKTGYFFDQRANRRLLAPIVGGARVLDCFTYAGAFALHAARHGAAHVTAIDYSDDAIAAASRNAMINGLMGKVECKVANCFDLLRTWSDEKRQFDVIVLDPPAFAKSRAATEKALAGYKEINLRALKMIAPGGWLLTCSCSYHASREDFLKAVAHAAHDAHRRVRLVREGGQDADHPVHPAAPETNYLKCFLLKVE
jgi:23S rRNA (cytosine1962-C5)-methyltransferase